MKPHSIFFACFFIFASGVFTSCQNKMTSSTQKNDNQPDYRLNDLWILQSIDGQPVPMTAERPTLEINLKEKRAFGYSGCNRFTGNVTVNNEFVTFGPLASTRMACPDMDIENSYLAILSENLLQYKLEPNPMTLTLIANEHNLYYKKGD